MAAVSRRAFIAGGVAVGVGLAVGIPFAVGASGATSTGQQLVSRARLPRPFTQRLVVPPTLTPVLTGDVDRYEIVARTARARILPGLTTTIFGYNGIFPGPLIRSRSNHPIEVVYRNRLPVPIVTHLHGGHTPHDSDGYPTDYVYPEDMTYLRQHQEMSHETPMPAGDTTNGTRTYRYPLRQRAAMLWYHDHRMDFTGPSVWFGLAGAHIVNDDEEDALGLPDGAREIPLVLTDRAFNDDGSLLYPAVDRTLTTTPGVTGGFVAGVLGDVMLVNGVPWPVADVERASYRIRMLNACNARRLRLRLDPPPTDGIVQIGTEGGLLDAPLTYDAFELAPAQRLDAVVDFSRFAPGTEVTLYNDFGDGGMKNVMRFRVNSTSGPRYTVPSALSSVERLDPASATVTRRFRFQRGTVDHRSGWIIGNSPFSPSEVSASPRLGDVEIWELFADFHHPVHIHLDPFQVISRGINGPGAFDAGWKDTIDLVPGEQARIAVRFRDHVGRFVFHCHNLEHEDMAMMANFVTHA
ncbi:multicopper oxidase family protein [Humibacter ginsenosidimutans]|uniref:Multicopper oxidase CueO n=1 Tax=Humibacter ginsenosidimutans TaxID=2599293 RepID=A0A5B8M8L6_9MICO|nr:multicopper oxidase family protein [Humibacter ginsenosidimutans]QDZ15952.1 multicopper oxidase family protein [Humibacter ginsenosidimutans]